MKRWFATLFLASVWVGALGSGTRAEPAAPLAFHPFLAPFLAYLANHEPGAAESVLGPVVSLETRFAFWDYATRRGAELTELRRQLEPGRDLLESRADSAGLTVARVAFADTFIAAALLFGYNDAAHQGAVAIREQYGELLGRRPPGSAAAALAAMDSAVSEPVEPGAAPPSREFCNELAAAAAAGRGADAAGLVRELADAGDGLARLQDAATALGRDWEDGSRVYTAVRNANPGFTMTAALYHYTLSEYFDTALTVGFALTPGALASSDTPSRRARLAAAGSFLAAIEAALADDGRRLAELRNGFEPLLGEYRDRAARFQALTAAGGAGPLAARITPADEYAREFAGAESAFAARAETVRGLVAWGRQYLDWAAGQAPR